jgi:hypothetical protein
MIRVTISISKQSHAHNLQSVTLKIERDIGMRQGRRIYEESDSRARERKGGEETDDGVFSRVKSVEHHDDGETAVTH